MLNEMKFIRFRNDSKHRVIVSDLGIDCNPGEECQVPEAYASPRRTHGGDRGPSVLEQLARCPGCAKVADITVGGELIHPNHCALAPINEEDAARFSRTPDVKPPAGRMPTVRDLVSAGVPEGVAEQLVKAAHAARQPLSAEEKRAKAPTQPKLKTLES